MSDVYIVNPLRTAIGSFQGTLAAFSATDLAAVVVREVYTKCGLSAAAIDEVILGCVLTSGLGQAPARQVLRKAGLADSTQAATINKVCSSGLYSVMLAARNVRFGISQAVIAGGMESMSNAPYLLPQQRSGAKLGHSKALDSIITDGLWDPYHDYHMGNAAELCASTKNISRQDQDAFALESYRRANDAIASGIFASEIVAMKQKSKSGDVSIDTDEEPGRVKRDKVPTIPAVFQKDGTVTAANASSINDGAAAMLVCSEAYLKKHKLTPSLKLVGEAWYGQAPEWFTTAPVGAVNSLLQKTKKSVSEIDLFEINEAFAAVALACGADLTIPSEKLNIYGGAVALGHPIGASGARILVTLNNALARNSGKFGIAAICNGGGEATAVMVEKV